MKAIVPSHSHLFLLCSTYNTFQSLKGKIQVTGILTQIFLFSTPIKDLSYCSLMPRLTCPGTIPKQKGLMLNFFTYCLDAYNTTSIADAAFTKGLSGNFPAKVVSLLVFYSSFTALTHKLLFQFSCNFDNYGHNEQDSGLSSHPNRSGFYSIPEYSVSVGSWTWTADFCNSQGIMKV